MIKKTHIFFIFIPAIIIAGLALYVQIISYQPLIPQQDETEEAKAKNSIQIPIFPDDPIIGNKQAATTIVAFEDFTCDGCKAQFFMLEKLLEKHPNKFKIIWKGLPVSKFPYSSELAHKYSYCANEQNKFFEFQQLAFTNNDNLSEEILNMIISEIGLDGKKLLECLSSEDTAFGIYRTEQIASILNIQEVPTMFINNKQINPPQLIEGWEILLSL